MTDQRKIKLSLQAIGLILIFAAIPIIAYLKLEYDDKVWLGVMVSIMMAYGVIDLARNDDLQEEDQHSLE